MIPLLWGLALLWVLPVNGQRRHYYMDELCKTGYNILDLQFSSDSPSTAAAATLKLTKGDYPVGIECTLTVVPQFPHTSIFLQLVQVNLRGNDVNCFDILTIQSLTETMELCHQKPSTNHNDSSMWSLTSRDSLEITYSSNASVGDSNTDGLGFAINLISVYQTKDANVCKSMDGFMCSEKERCIPLTLACDNEEDCSQGNDEDSSSCTKITEDDISAKKHSNILFSILLVTMLMAFVASCIYVIFYRLRHLIQIQRASQNGQGVFVISAFNRNADIIRTPEPYPDVVGGRRETPPPYESPPPPYHRIIPSPSPFKQSESRAEAAPVGTYDNIVRIS